MLRQIAEIGAGLAVVIILGSCVRPFLNRAAKKPERPETIKEEDWKAIVERSPAGIWTGFFERLISLFSFWNHEYSIIGGWLAFKVATKWEVWKNIVQVPAELEGVSSLDWYKGRNALGSWILARFLIGTLVNMLIGSVGAYAGSHFWEIVRGFS